MSTIRSSSGKSEIADQYATLQAEKEKLRAEHEEEMDRLKKSYEGETEHTRDRFEKSIQNEKIQSYENLKDAKRKFTATEREQKRLGDARLQNQEAEYRQEENRIEKEGKSRIKEATRKQAALDEYQRTKANEANLESRQNLSQNARQIIHQYESAVEDLRQQKLDELENRRGEHGVALQQIREHYDSREQKALTQMKNEAQRIEHGVDQHIHQSLVANAHRVSDHLNRSDDPFYQMAAMDSQFSDEGSHYQLRVAIPDHESRSVRVQVNGQELLLTGTRKNELKAIGESGQEMSTSSYQSFTEKFKFDSPVDAKAMMRSEADGVITFSIPKYGPNHRMRSDRVSATLNPKDLEMSRDQDFKQTLPKPTIKT